jgi:hypothetical protein
MTQLRRVSEWLSESVEVSKGLILYVILILVRNIFWDNAVLRNGILAVQGVIVALIVYGVFIADRRRRQSMPRWFPYLAVGGFILGAVSALLVLELTE